MSNHHSRQQGGALLIVLILIATCSAVTLTFMAQTRQEILGAKATTRSLHADEKTISGTDMAIALLMQDITSTDFDHIQEPWAQLFTENSPYADIFQTLGITGQIQDEASRFPINRIANEKGINMTLLTAFTRLLRQPEVGLTTKQATELAQRIADWIDADTMTLEQTPENAIYRAANLHYSPKNAPLTTLSELLLIPGVTASMYHGNSKTTGLKALTTVRSNGKVNVNTASVPVLASLVPVEKADSTARDVAEFIVKQRENHKAPAELKDPKWYRNLLPESLQTTLISNLISIKSMNFTVAVETDAHGVKRSRTSWIRRNTSAQDTPTITIVAQEIQ